MKIIRMPAEKKKKKKKKNEKKFYYCCCKGVPQQQSYNMDVGLSISQHQRTITQQSSPLFPIIPIIYSCFSNSRFDHTVAIEKCYTYSTGRRRIHTSHQLAQNVSPQAPLLVAIMVRLIAFLYVWQPSIAS